MDQNMKSYEILDILTTKPKSSIQEKIITDAWDNDNSDFFVGMAIALDKNNKVKVNKVPVIEVDGQEDIEEYTLTFTEFTELIADLNNNNYNDDEIKEKIINIALKSDPDEWNKWYRKILLRNIEKEIDVKTVMTVIQKLLK